MAIKPQELCVSVKRMIIQNNMEITKELLQSVSDELLDQIYIEVTTQRRAAVPQQGVKWQEAYAIGLMIEVESTRRANNRVIHMTLDCLK